MNKTKRQYDHARQHARDIKRLYPIKEALQILEVENKYYLTNNSNFQTRINFKDFNKLVKWTITAQQTQKKKAAATAYTAATQ